jgi:DNA-binding PadR family transcriptional regulator
VSPVFRHGRLRLYLLKLLDESPRHGYEVIRLLQDRFMGIYAPSPGTIYPRLARLEEDGLVTHEEIDGKKVYSITDKGREEIRSRLGDLADLEDELTESLRDVAREISEDVRDTVRTIREELASAAREFRNDSDRASRSAGDARPEEAADGDASAGRSGESERIRDEARRRREQMRASFRAQGRGRSDWAAWQGRSGRSQSPWGTWADWTGESGAGEPESDEHGTAGEKVTSGGPRSRRGGPNPFSDLERMAMQFATELRSAAKQAGDIGERSLNDLRDILTDTLAKVRVEVFSDTEPGSAESGSTASGSTASGSTASGSTESGTGAKRSAEASVETSQDGSPKPTADEQTGHSGGPQDDGTSASSGN